MKRLLYLLFLLLSRLSIAQDSLQVMAYNLYRFPTHPPENREFLLEKIVAQARPDLLMACEIVHKEGSDSILHTAFRMLPDSFAASEFVYCSTAKNDPLQQMVYYNTRKLSLAEQKTLKTAVRDINHYTFFLNTEPFTEDTTFLDVFVTHLKSGNGSADRAVRKAMADTFINALQRLPPNHHVLFSGDLNLYTDQEPAYQALLDTTHSIVMKDPIDRPGDWHGHPGFQSIHTQSTRKTIDGFGLGGAGGGMDDRFDFILISKSLTTHGNLYYLPESYLAFGNNGNCFNKAVNNDTCVGTYGQALRNLLFQMSDHLPVVMTLITERNFPAATTVAPTTPLAPDNLYLPYGNIVDQQLTLGVRKPASDAPKSFLIYDASGRLWTQSSFALHEQTIDIFVGHWPPGLYFVRYGKEVIRFVKR